ncbi:MAG: hypothetical protein ACM3YO_04325 [Bacteroidota bacterium]
MPAAMTRYRLTPHGRGVTALLSGFRALSTVLPTAQVEEVSLDGQRFPIDTRCFPPSVWSRLIATPDWHPRLLEQLFLHLRAKPEELPRLQTSFREKIGCPHAKVRISGRMPYDPDGTPGMLNAWGIPRLKRMGCKLSVLDPAMHHPRPEDLALRRLQIQLWASDATFASGSRDRG